MTSTCNSSIENASNVKVMAGLQVNQTDPATKLKFISGKSANVGPGTISFSVEKEIGSDAPADIVSTLIDINKSVTWLNRPNQLNLIARWVFGEPIFMEGAPTAMLYITSNIGEQARINATVDTFKIEKSVDGTTWAEVLSVPLPATIEAVIIAINAETGFFATSLYGDITANYSFEDGIIVLSGADLVPAAPYASSTAILSIFKPLSGCPGYMSFLYKLFANSDVSEYTEDIGAQALSMSIDLPKDGTSTVVTPYFALDNIPVEAADVPAVIDPSDTVPPYKGAKGLYNLILGNTQYPTIDTVAWLYTNNTSSVKNWYGNQMATAPKSFDASLQITAWLEYKFYQEIVSLYTATEEDKSYIPTLMYVVNQLLVDGLNKVPYLFGSLYPKGKISAAPELTVEADSDIPCNFTISPTSLGGGITGDSMIFFTITEA